MRFLIVLFLFTLNINFTYSQTSASQEDKWFHLSHLSTGILFVEIPNYKKGKIKLLEQSTKEKDKKQLKEEKEHNVKLQNEIFDSFQKNFNYCPVYFYHVNHRSKILSGNYDGIVLNHKQEIINFQTDTIINRYTAIYGVAHVAGDLDKYNGKGFQINYINGNKMEGIKSSIFYEVDPRYFSMLFRLFNRKNWEILAIEKSVIGLNNNLYRERNSIVPVLMALLLLTN